MSGVSIELQQERPGIRRTGKLERSRQSSRDTIHDERVLQAANAAANEVVRNTSDCEALRAALPEALRQIDEAQSQVRTATGRQMADALRTRVKNTATLCP